MKGTTGKYSARAKKYKSRAEKFMMIDALYKRTLIILNKTGLRNDSKAYLCFDLAFYSMEVDERRKLLKDIFSPDGRGIKLEHEPHIKMLETFIEKVVGI